MGTLRETCRGTAVAPNESENKQRGGVQCGTVALGSCSSRWCLSVYGCCCETRCSHTPGHARGWEMMPAWHVVIDWSGLWLRAAATKSTLRPGQWGVVRLVWIYRSAPSLSRGLLSFVLVCLTVLLGRELRNGVIIGLKTDPCVVFLVVIKHRV